MKLNKLTISGVLFALLLVGAGCSATTQPTKQLGIVDAALKIYGDVPSGWSPTAYNTFYHDATAFAGLADVTGAVNWGFGPKDAKGEVQTKMHIIAIPQKFLAAYDAAKDPSNAVKMFTAGEYTVYTSTDLPTDPGVQQLIASLKYQP